MASFNVPYSALIRTLQNEAILLERERAMTVQHALDITQEMARQNPRWIGVADNIEVWDEFDRMVIGVRDEEFVSTAFAAEYGTEDYPPAPLLRTIDSVLTNRAANRGARTRGQW